MARKPPLPLDDPRWMIDGIAYDKLRKHLGNWELATLDLAEALVHKPPRVRQHLRSMRRHLKTGERVFMEAEGPDRDPFLEAFDNAKTVFSNDDWAIFVWQPDFEKMLGGEPRSEKIDDTPPPAPSSRPGPKAMLDWKGRAAREVARQAFDNRRMPTAREMCEWCGAHLNHEPDIRDMQKLLKGLRVLFS